MARAREFEEDAVLAKAEAVFRQKGFGAATMLDIARASGVQRGSLYHAYGDKDALFLRTFDRYEARFLTQARGALDQADARQALLAFFDAAVANMSNGPAAQGCLTTKVATEAANESRKIAARVRKLLDALDGIVAEALARPALARAIRLPPPEAARLVVTFTRGLAVMERVYHDPAALRATAGALVDLLAPPAAAAGSPATKKR